MPAAVNFNYTSFGEFCTDGSFLFFGFSFLDERKFAFLCKKRIAPIKTAEVLPKSDQNTPFYAKCGKEREKFPSKGQLSGLNPVGKEE
ncbi:MAG: hypothetical protein PUC47_05245 [Oscillospiraceae bacterium]|nr:hypothetical protein [Oscillospiraceae bacterium]